MVDTLSLIVSILCAVGSFISFLLAQKEKKEAKESERQTQIYAENANQANLATKKLYDELSKYIQHQHVIDAQVELKNKIRSYIAKNQNSRTQCIADFVGLSKEEAFQLLLDMMHTDPYNSRLRSLHS